MVLLDVCMEFLQSTCVLVANAAPLGEVVTRFTLLLHVVPVPGAHNSQHTCPPLLAQDVLQVCVSDDMVPTCWCLQFGAKHSLWQDPIRLEGTTNRSAANSRARLKDLASTLHMMDEIAP